MRIKRCVVFGKALMVAAITLGIGSLVPTWAGSSTFLDVCTSGCTYSSVQDAIDTISDSSATKVYTIFIDSGILSSGSTTTTNGKSYINFVGRGEGVSIWQATSAWFTGAGTLNMHFLDLTNSSHITIRGLTIDARTNDPGGIDPNSHVFSCVTIANSDRILVEGAELQGAAYGFWEYAGSSGNLIEVFNSKILATYYAAKSKNSRWHIYSSEIKAVQTGSESAPDETIALALSDSIDVTVWGSHLHAESSKSGGSGNVAAVKIQSAQPGSNLAVIGTQLHLKMTTATIGSSSRPMFDFYFQSAAASGASHYDFAGSYLNYESPASLGQGRIGGIGFNKSSSGTTINFVGGGIFDVGGSGGTDRADVVQSGTLGTAPTLNVAGSKIGPAVAASGSLPTGLGSGYQTLNSQYGSVTLSGGTATVTLPSVLPDAVYSVSVSTGVNETIRVTGKSTTGFTVTSSNGSSSASVDWILVR